MKKIIALIIAAVVVLGLWFGILKKSSPETGDASAAEKMVARAEKRTLSTTVELSGDVTPDTTLDVKPEVGGKIKALHVEAGQAVDAGALLVEIDDRDLLTEKASATTEIEGAKIVVERNRRNLERGNELFSAKLINQETYDNLTADFEISLNNLEKSQRRLDLVEDRLRKTKILAPSAGTVLSVGVLVGQVVTAAASVNSGTSLMQIADLSKLLVDTTVNQVDVSKLRLGQKVELSTESLKNLKTEAVINFIAPVASTKNNVKGFQVKALIEHPDARLRPGMTVNVTVPVAVAKDAVTVPISAVFRGEDNARVVYVRKGDGSEARKVEVGISNYQYAEIKSGLKEGEEILLIDPRRAPKKS